MESHDLLYEVFEKALFQETEEEPTIESFAQSVVSNYLFLLSRQGVFVPHSMKDLLEADLQDEVIDMTRKKTYGHNSLADFRRKKITSNREHQD